MRRLDSALCSTHVNSVMGVCLLGANSAGTTAAICPASGVANIATAVQTKTSTTKAIGCCYCLLLLSGSIRTCAPKSTLGSTSISIYSPPWGEGYTTAERGERGSAFFYSPPCTRRSYCEPHLPPWLRRAVHVPTQGERVRCCLPRSSAPAASLSLCSPAWALLTGAPGGGGVII